MPEQKVYCSDFRKTVEREPRGRIFTSFLGRLRVTLRRIWYSSRSTEHTLQKKESRFYLLQFARCIRIDYAAVLSKFLLGGINTLRDIADSERGCSILALSMYYSCPFYAILQNQMTPCKCKYNIIISFYASKKMVREITKMYCLHFSKDVAAERCGDGVLVQNVLECFPFFA